MSDICPKIKKIIKQLKENQYKKKKGVKIYVFFSSFGNNSERKWCLEAKLGTKYLAGPDRYLHLARRRYLSPDHREWQNSTGYS